MNFSLPHRNTRVLSSIAMGLLALVGTAAIHAQVVVVSGNPVIGSSNPITATPPVAGPSARSCTVTLFQNLEFADYNTKDYTYTPPASCPGPWSKVVFTADFTVTAGTQYDRTAEFYLGGANIYFGTTAEPSSTLSPSWHVERDVTELSSVFSATQAGTAILGNFVGVYNGTDYNGIIYGNAHLIFYPALLPVPIPSVPNLVIGLPGNSGAASLNTSSSVYSQVVTLPTNVTSAYLDVIAQSQSDDEFWYTCVPNSLSSELESCGSTGFRETEITIDGQPAGVAPVYPWIYTGGIDPFLWQPIPGLQTLNFVPYRVDLTPFAGLLSNGDTHTVGIQVYNADSYFQVAANLLVYTDPVLSHVTGSLETDTLSAEPDPVIANTIATSSSGSVTGQVVTTSDRKYTIAGTVNTWQGPVQTTVSRAVYFIQVGTFNLTASQDQQDILQSNTVNGDTATTVRGVTTHQTVSYVYPFTLDYNYSVNPDGSSYQTVTSNQQDVVNTDEHGAVGHPYSTSLSNTVIAGDTLNFDSGGNFTGNTGTSSSQNYLSTDSFGVCYSESLTSASGVLTGAVSGAGCHHP